jgi:RHS repeat-associated protein
MNTYRMTRVAIPALALIAWLLAPETAHCYFNASTGRWLSRDPLDERGAKLLRFDRDSQGVQQVTTYCFVNNNPISYADYLGLAACRYANPCGQAAREFLNGTDAGGVICCGGKKYACDWASTRGVQNTKAKELIHRCTLLHERTHFKIVDCPCDSGVSRPGPENQRVADASECQAYGRETICLKQSMADCHGDRACEIEVQHEADFVAGQRDVYCARAKGSSK